MNQQAFFERLADKKMIASVKEAKVLEKALAADVGAVVLSIGTCAGPWGHCRFSGKSSAMEGESTA